MSVDQNQLRKLAELDDGKFAELIRTVVIAAGGNRDMADTVKKAAPEIKQKLLHASGKEIDEIVQLVGRGKAEQVLHQIKQEKGDG